MFKTSVSPHILNFILILSSRLGSRPFHKRQMENVWGGGIVATLDISENKLESKYVSLYSIDYTTNEF